MIAIFVGVAVAAVIGGFAFVISVLPVVNITTAVATVGGIVAAVVTSGFLAVRKPHRKKICDILEKQVEILQDRDIELEEELELRKMKKELNKSIQERQQKIKELQEDSITTEQKEKRG